MEPQRSDQELFDATVDKNGKKLLQVLGGLAIFAAFLMSMIALVQSGSAREVKVVAQPAAQHTTIAPVSAVTLETKVVGSGRRGPDGKMHDMFTVTNFVVKAGQPVRLKIDNTDDVPHSITSPSAGVNIIAQPGVHTYTLLVAAAGRFQWNCMLPCDTDAGGWAMQHPGYMSGYITAA